jgi:protein TonB
MSIERRAVRQVPLATPFGRQTRERGKLRGLGLSAVAHLVLLALVLYAQHKAIEAGLMPGLGPNRPGGGGGGGAAVVLFVRPPAAPAAPAVEAPHLEVITTPAVQPPEEVPVQMSPEEIRSLLQAATPGNGTGAGPGSGTGSGGGSGSGTGPGTGPDSGGAGGNVYAPRLDGFIMPPVDRPASVRGTTVRVRFEVSARGEVLDVAIDPPIRDRHYRDEFLDRLRRYKFTPAYTRDGRAVPGVFEISIAL